ncbi:MAG TPA: hypothetical protein VGG14_14045 [Candidatus Sulfotelmatobacter sp.]
MPRMIDQIRASKLPSNMMQFAARGALSVPPEENIEILVYLARNNKVFGDLARITLAGWDEKASLAAAANPKTPPEVLNYFVSPENVRPKLLPGLLENSSVAAGEIAKMAQSAPADSVGILLKSARVRTSKAILESLRSNPYVKGSDAVLVADLLKGNSAGQVGPNIVEAVVETKSPAPVAGQTISPPAQKAETQGSTVEKDASSHDAEVPDETVSAYLTEHAADISAEDGKPFQAVGGIVDLLGADYFPVVEVKDIAGPQPSQAVTAASGAAVSSAPIGMKTGASGAAAAPKRENTVQKINRLDVKGRIQLALKGNKEERSLLIRDGTKVVALAVLEAPKLSDGEVEKFASQKNVLEAVLRQIPLKRRFMKNYPVVRNLVANPRTPLDLSLNLMKHVMVNDLKNLSSNKEVSETVRKLALKMFKQKQDEANKK